MHKVSLPTSAFVWHSCPPRGQGLTGNDGTWLDLALRIPSKSSAMFVKGYAECKGYVARVCVNLLLCCRIMREYMPKVGTLGHDMMFRSTTIQVS